MSSKLGRPFSEDPRLMRVEFKMTESELERLDYCCQKTKRTRSEVIRNGINHTFCVLKDLEKK